ncbi:MAG: RluA family pseudouridine synthase, partial [Pseudomonadota bacterium]
QVRVDGGRAKMETRLGAGQTVRLPPIASAGRPVEAASGDGAALHKMLLHKDDHVAVLNKPFGLAVQGGSGVTRHVDGMLEAWRDRKGRKPRLVHRLDRDTTGVLVVALTRSAAASLSEAFKGRDTEKTYWAVVRGHPSPPSGRLSTLIMRDPADGERMCVPAGKPKEAQRATTLYDLLDRAGQLSLMEFHPVTGRTHQLRVHAAHLGIPILGDPKYFNIENWAFPGGLQNRLHLHARRIVAPHPGGGMLDITAPPSPHFAQALSVLGLSTNG